MRSTKHTPQRNILDLADPVQVRTLTKRLRISASILRRVAAKSGNSIAAIVKEVAFQRAAELSQSEQNQKVI